MSSFIHTHSVRLQKKEYDSITKVVNEKRKYNSPSHFLRCAAIKLLREEDEKNE